MSFVKNDNRSGHQTMHPSSSAPVLSTDEKWALPARAEAATRSTATVLETPIAPLIDTTTTLRTCMAEMYEQFVAIRQNFTGPFYH